MPLETIEAFLIDKPINSMSKKDSILTERLNIQLLPETMDSLPGGDICLFSSCPSVRKSHQFNWIIGVELPTHFWG